MNRFPLGLTLASAIAFAILCGLGGWQLQRLAWKQDLIARVEVLKTAPAEPISPVLARARRGEDVAWTRVSVRCAAGGPDMRGVRNTVRDGEIVWRAISLCALAGAPYRTLLADRGLIAGSAGAVAAPRVQPSAPGALEGVLAPAADVRNAPFAGEAPFVLMVERETPAASGLTPDPLPPALPNRHLEYALTWFGLAAVLAAVYAALLRRRLKAP